MSHCKKKTEKSKPMHESVSPSCCILDAEAVYLTKSLENYRNAGTDRAVHCTIFIWHGCTSSWRKDEISRPTGRRWLRLRWKVSESGFKNECTRIWRFLSESVLRRNESTMNSNRMPIRTHASNETSVIGTTSASISIPKAFQAVDDQCSISDIENLSERHNPKDLQRAPCIIP